MVLLLRPLSLSHLIQLTFRYNIIRQQSTTTVKIPKYIPKLTQHVRLLLGRNLEYHNYLFNPTKIMLPSLSNNTTTHNNGYLPVTQKFVELSKNNYCDLKNLGDDCYQDIISEIENSASKMSDEDILLILHSMTNFPFCTQPNNPNYKKLWKCLDTLCKKRIDDWDISKSFIVDDAWHPFGLSFYVEFQWILVKRFFRKSQILDKKLFVRFMLCVVQCVSIPKDIRTFEVEHNLNQFVDELSIDELVIVLSVIVKLRKKIHSESLVRRIVDIVVQNVDNVDSTSASIIGRAIQKTVFFGCEDLALKLQKAFIPHVDRLTGVTCITLASCGIHGNAVDYDFVSAMSSKVQQDISLYNLHEIEKLCIFAEKFNVTYNNMELPNTIIKELRSSKRTDLAIYPECIPTILDYLSSFNQIYVDDLIDQVLNPTYIKKNYGKNIVEYPRCLLNLDINVSLDNPNYSGNRLSEKLRKNLLARRTYYFASHRNGKRPYLEIRFDEISQLLNEIYNTTSNMMYYGSFLPQFHCAEALICTDRRGNPVEIPDFIKKYDVHEVKTIPKEKKTEDILFHLFSCTNRNIIYGTRDLIGSARKNERLLQNFGYIVHRVYDDWLKMNNDDRKKLLKSLISNACMTTEIKHNRNNVIAN